jgi:PAS domain S-box-containing protein
MHDPALTATAGHQRLVEQIDELAALYQLTDALYRARSVTEVYDAALDAITQALGCGRASVLLFDEAGVMRFAAWRGLSADYRRTLEGHSPWSRAQVDPEPIFVADIEGTDEPDWIKSTIRQEGISSLAFLPLMADGGVIGKFMTYYATRHEFTKREKRLAVAIARQIGFSLERAGAERARRAAEDEVRQSESRFRLMSEQAPVMIWTSDAHGRCQHLNEMLRAFWKVEESAISDFDWQSTIHPDDVERVTRCMAEAIADRSSVTVRARYRNATGEYRVLETGARPHFSAAGEFRGMIGVNVDVTERDKAARALRDSEERFRMAVETSPSGMVMTDGQGRIVLVNAQAEKLFGYDREELIGQKVEILVPERFRQTHPDFRDAYGGRPIARPMGAGRDLFALRKDGGEVPVEIGLSPMETADGRMTLAAIVDISERKRADSQRELLLEELNHRVKNTLAVVQGIAHQTFNGSEVLRQAKLAFEGRLIALAAAHNLLTLSNWQEASLEQLASDALQARSANRDRVHLTGPATLLPPKEALAITMALHELCTNAMKYGALSNDDGRIELSWSRREGPPAHFRLLWRERGGPVVTPPGRRGFGTQLVERTLAQELDGEVVMEFRPDGLVCTIDALLSTSGGRAQ